MFKADPANKGVIMDRGLWAWTRHPNYFGDACVWWGLWLITIDGWLSLATVLSPRADDVLPGVRHRRAADREDHGRPAGLRRILVAHIVFRSATAQIGAIMTTAVAERLGYRS